jgi:hypothetical protein
MGTHTTLEIVEMAEAVTDALRCAGLFLTEHPTNRSVTRQDLNAEALAACLLDVLKR